MKAEPAFKACTLRIVAEYFDGSARLVYRTIQYARSRLSFAARQASCSKSKADAHYYELYDCPNCRARPGSGFRPSKPDSKKGDSQEN